MKECYKEINFKPKQLAMIETINAIIGEYIQQGYTLTVRQLYYQLVARDIIANSEKSYKYITRTVNDGRIAGYIDWDAIEDRTRAFETRGRWQNPNDIFEASAKQYHTDPWMTQGARPFVVVEKEALVGVFQRVCHQYDVPLLAARGYPSASVVREFVKDQVLTTPNRVVILHFGDHDPSGIDMTRDLDDRFTMFSYGDDSTYELQRLALNLDQVRTHKPPPNPAKQTDSRFIEYKRRFGVSSWELDALNPTILSNLARDAITAHIDDKAWKKWEAGLAKVKAKMLTHAKAFKA